MADRTKVMEALVLVAENVEDTAPKFAEHRALREIMASVAGQYGLTLGELTKAETAKIREAYEKRAATTNR